MTSSHVQARVSSGHFCELMRPEEYIFFKLKEKRQRIEPLLLLSELGHLFYNFIETL